MNYHVNFHKFVAKDNRDLGIQMGGLFKENLQKVLNKEKNSKDWDARILNAYKAMDFTKRFFPQYLEELEGQAEGARVEFMDLWTYSLEDEAQTAFSDRCTTVISNNAELISHNEDWNKDSQDLLSIVLKSVGDQKIFELYYFGTLGGNSISINNHGYVSTINSLISQRRNSGIPRNVFARWFSEIKDPEVDLEKLKDLPRSLGYSCNIVGDGMIWNVEFDSERCVVSKPQSPYVHTNHYLAEELKSFEANDNSTGTFERYQRAQEVVRTSMSEKEITEACSDQQSAPIKSILNERTIGRCVVNQQSKKVYIWLKREEGMGFVEYNIEGLFQEV